MCVLDDLNVTFSSIPKCENHCRRPQSFVSLTIAYYMCFLIGSRFSLFSQTVYTNRGEDPTVGLDARGVLRAEGIDLGKQRC